MLPAQIAGIPIPDSALAREATEYVRDVEDDLLFHHSLRVFVFGALGGARRGLTFDPELLYVGAMFHDLGLVEGHRSAHDRFEVDGANAAREFLRRHGVPAEQVRIVWDAIALHTTPGIPRHKEPEVALVTAGVELDVLGIEHETVTPDQHREILAELPRRDFKDGIIRAFAAGIAHKPETAFGNVKADVLARELPGYERTDFCSLILASPFAE